MDLQRESWWRPGETFSVNGVVVSVNGIDLDTTTLNPRWPQPWRDFTDRYARGEADRCRCTGFGALADPTEECRCCLAVTQEDLRCNRCRALCRPRGIATLPASAAGVPIREGAP